MQQNIKSTCGTCYHRSTFEPVIIWSAFDGIAITVWLCDWIGKLSVEVIKVKIRNFQTKRSLQAASSLHA